MWDKIQESRSEKSGHWKTELECIHRSRLNMNSPLAVSQMLKIQNEGKLSFASEVILNVSSDTMCWEHHKIPSKWISYSSIWEYFYYKHLRLWRVRNPFHPFFYISTIGVHIYFVLGIGLDAKYKTIETLSALNGI